ncbi:MAG: molybdenum cofactor biosynthesis protein MoaE [Deltaproteobacteria bacterium]|nr:molybdenum cofactor biosynthesis protein MoaE [Deltaproteobacteria bacterium]
MEDCIEIVHKPISLKKLSQWIDSPTCGAQVHFLGKVRNHNEGRDVLGIEYQAYTVMAVEEMKKIVHEAKQQWHFYKCAFVHRLGKLGMGEVSVALFISAPHRKEAFNASQWMISEMKKRVPIWKKEFYLDGSSWIGLQQCHHEIS